MTLNVKVQAVESLCPNIKSLYLVAEEDLLPPFSAGSHIDVHLGNGLVRQYSLCNTPNDTNGYQIAVLQDAQSRGGSEYVHQHIQAGQTLSISPPRNLFALAPTHSKAVLFAGGIGITPLLSMAEQFLADNIDFQLIYCCKDASHIAFQQRLQQEDLNNKVVFIHENLSENPQLLQPFLQNADAQAHLYTCGPNGFMQTVFEQAKSCGWQESQLHKESFQADIDNSASEAFDVKIASSGEVFVIPADKSITQVLEEQGYFIPVSCEQGICGTCLTNVLEGEINHCDQFLTDEEKAANQIFTPCCSRAKSGLLVLDL